ncbi:MAG: hypothetical protein ABIV26_02240, partial [Candidatus Limnocylindrales bacterium]
IDALDADAYRGAWGGTITTDGPEAEIATPPVTVGPGVARRISAIAAAGALELRSVLPNGASLTGYSTHVSVDVPRGREERIAREVARSWVPALTWLLDGPDSPGILVRPRPGRVEIGGDHVDGERLGLAAIFAVGAVRAAAAESHPLAPLHRRTSPLGRLLARLPRLEVRPAPAVERYGWFVGDRELGAALHSTGSATMLPLRAGGSISAAEHLRRAWAAARATLVDIDAPTLQRIDELVALASPWAELTQPMSALHLDGTTTVATPLPTIGTVGQPVDSSSDPSLVAWVSAARHHVRPGFVASPAIMSWDFVVLRLRDATHEAFACLPRDVLGGALAALDAGRLDALLEGYLGAERVGDRVLASSRATRAVGLFRAVGRVADLASQERDPAGGQGKRQRSEQQQQQQPNQPAGSTPPAPAPAVPALPAASVAGAAGLAGVTILGLPAVAAAAIAGAAVVAIVGGTVLLGGNRVGPGPSAAITPGVSVPGGGLGVGDPLCDALLAPSSISGVLGTDVTSIEVAQPVPLNRNYPNGTHCLWRLSDSSSFDLDFGYEYDQSYVTFKLASLGTLVSGLGENAAYLEGSPNTLGWGVGSDPARMFYLHSIFDQATMENLARNVVIPQGPAATPANLVSAECDPWLTAVDVAAATGLTPDSIDGYNYLNEGQPADCKWTFAEGGFLEFFALEQGPYGGPDVDENGNLVPGQGDPVPELGRGAYAAGPGPFPPEVHWFPDTQLQLYLSSDVVPVAAMIQVALAVGIPADWGGAAAGADFTSGSASIRLTGEGSGSAQLVFSDELMGGTATGPSYPLLVWSDGGRSTLGIYTLTRHATGVLSTEAGTLGIGLSFDKPFIAGFQSDSYQTGLGLGHDPVASGLSCSATVTITPTGGISGTFTCPNINDPSLVVGAEGEFQAEMIGTGVTGA